ncbi:MAG: hypothetical protein IPL63_18110 [Saprospiraceae bacterium]|nr:hypothetical protein [Saprospiraceae bacterium]MBK8549185.1 hypothetical protein [Saprospiraceae bacterium]MBK8820242.1 hypothetical protein [Saprospiraceae bacterium]MBK8855408.1 hypothetical protein [Saprospiraceae bacterium]MBK9043734.1 hypothetical protein [Saprospiraceae bacterium]
MKYYFVFLVVLASFSSCYYDVEEELYQTNCDVDSISYSRDVVPIITNYCISCHSEALVLGGINLSNYEKVIVYINNGSFQGSIKHQGGFTPMPQNQAKLSKCDISKVETWVANGAPNN